MMFVCCHPGLPPEAQSAIALLETPEIRERLENYHLFHAVLGEIEHQRQNPEAATHFRRAIELAESSPERALLAERLEVHLAGFNSDRMARGCTSSWKPIPDQPSRTRSGGANGMRPSVT
jgi:predicted RNA polymerase sigma factor